jgi:hypothetical protein
VIFIEVETDQVQGFLLPHHVGFDVVGKAKAAMTTTSKSAMPTSEIIDGCSHPK